MRWQPLVYALVSLAACQPVAPGPSPAPSAQRTAALVPTGAASSAPAHSSAPLAASSATSSATAVTGMPNSVPNSRVPDSDWLRQLLLKSDKRFERWLARAEELKLQVLVAIVREGPDGAKLERHGLRVDAEYVYPASAIKTYLAVAALRRLAKLADEHHSIIDRRTALWRCRDEKGRCDVYRVDKSGANDDGSFSASTEIRKMLRYSDNDSYGRLHDFVGHRELNEWLGRVGFSSVRLHHSMGRDAELSRRTPRIVLMPRGKGPLTFASRNSDLQLAPTPAAKLHIGKAHIDDHGKKVREPLSFETKNYASLRELQLLSLALVRPELAPQLKLGLSEEQRTFLLRQMSSLHPRDRPELHKPLLPGVLRVRRKKHIRYVGKSGRAYGFHLENAYIGLRDGSRGFFVVASVYANPNGVLNDDAYSYDGTSRALLAALGKALAGALLSKKDAGAASTGAIDHGR